MSGRMKECMPAHARAIREHPHPCIQLHRFQTHAHTCKRAVVYTYVTLECTLVHWVCLHVPCILSEFWHQLFPSSLSGVQVAQTGLRGIMSSRWREVYEEVLIRCALHIFTALFSYRQYERKTWRNTGTLITHAKTINKHHFTPFCVVAGHCAPTY